MTRTNADNWKEKVNTLYNLLRSRVWNRYADCYSFQYFIQSCCIVYIYHSFPLTPCTHWIKSNNFFICFCCCSFFSYPSSSSLVLFYFPTFSFRASISSFPSAEHLTTFSKPFACCLLLSFKYSFTKETPVRMPIQGSQVSKLRLYREPHHEKPSRSPGDFMFLEES